MSDFNPNNVGNEIRDVIETAVRSLKSELRTDDGYIKSVTSTPASVALTYTTIGICAGVGGLLLFQKFFGGGESLSSEG